MLRVSCCFNLWRKKKVCAKSSKRGQHFEGTKTIARSKAFMNSQTLRSYDPDSPITTMNYHLIEELWLQHVNLGLTFKPWHHFPVSTFKVRGSLSTASWVYGLFSSPFKCLGTILHTPLGSSCSRHCKRESRIH